MLRTRDDQLRDLEGTAHLVDATSGADTGIRLLRWLGGGGMATVFLAERDTTMGAGIITSVAPKLVAVKLNKLSTERELRRLNLEPLALMKKELVALGRVMERRPPTEFVVGIYGSGSVDIEYLDPRDAEKNRTQRVPWLALEYIDGGPEGSTLRERVVRAGGGLDAVRVARLVRGIFNGAGVLHDSAVIHRDLKPDNIFIAGPIDDETPKIGDCGIARVDGLQLGTIAAVTPAYGGPEQVLSAFRPTVQNPLIGPWTDIFALAALTWFIIAGEDWCRDQRGNKWRRGERRSLRSAARMDPSFTTSPALLQELDHILGRAASVCLPARAWRASGADAYRQQAELMIGKAMFERQERFADVDSFAAALLPVLDDAARHGTAAAIREQRAPSSVRPTLLVADPEGYDAALAQVNELPPRTLASVGPTAADRANPGGVVFLPDGKALVRFGPHLVYFVRDRPHAVTVPSEHTERVAESHWIGRGPGGGFALAGDASVLLIRGGAFQPMSLPSRDSGAPIGKITALLADGRHFGVVTAEVEASFGGPELWLSVDGQTWSPPTLLPLGGDVQAIAAGPYGMLVVGARDSSARALHLSLDEQATVFTHAVHKRPPLVAATCGTTPRAWAAASGLVLAIGPDGVETEYEGDDDPVAMLALDIVGVPWLVTRQMVMRRHMDAWKPYYQRAPHRAPLVAIGFSGEGAHVIDAHGDGVLIVPHAWSSTEL